MRTLSVYWESTKNHPITQKALEYSLTIAKAGIIAAGVFANYTYFSPWVMAATGFPFLTLEGIKLFRTFVKNESPLGIIYLFTVTRIATSILFGTLALSRLNQLSGTSYDLFKLLTAAYFFSKALVPFLPLKLTVEQVHNFIDQYNSDSLPITSALTKAFFTSGMGICRVFDATKLDRPSEQALFWLHTQRANNTLKETCLEYIQSNQMIFSNLHDLEIQGELAPDSVAICDALTVFFLATNTLPEGEQKKAFDRLLDILIGHTLPPSLLDHIVTFPGFTKTNFLRSKVDKLVNSLQLEILKCRLNKLVEDKVYNGDELNEIARDLRAIGHEAEQCLILNKNPQVEKIRDEVQVLLKRILSFPRTQPICKGAPELDVNDATLDYLLGAVSNDPDREEKTKKIIKQLKAYFGVKKELLYQEMEERGYGTLQALIDKGILSKELLSQDYGTVIQKIMKCFERKWYQIKLPVGAVYKTAKLVIFDSGTIIRDFCHPKLRQIVLYRYFCYLGLPLIFYNSLITPIALGEEEMKKIKVPFISRILGEIDYLFTATVAMYPLLIASEFGLQFRYMKTTSVVFALALGYFKPS